MTRDEIRSRTFNRLSPGMYFHSTGTASASQPQAAPGGGVGGGGPTTCLLPPPVTGVLSSSQGWGASSDLPGQSTKRQRREPYAGAPVPAAHVITRAA